MKTLAASDFTKVKFYFDFTLVTVAMVTGKDYLTPIAHLFRQLLCERDISRLTPVSKCGCKSPKLDSVKVVTIASLTDSVA